MTGPIVQLAPTLWTEAERAELIAYLERVHQGALTREAIAFHFEAHLGFGFADYAIHKVLPTARAGERLLDLGSGFGSFVLVARANGLDARGIELAAFETEVARRRLRRLRPDDPSDTVFVTGDARTLALPDASVDIITLWNVLEHIDEVVPVLTAAHRLLRPGGRLFAICPNYLAWRLEAHYHVPWTPWLALVPRAAVSAYLRRCGRDPRFFETSIFRRTNWGVQRLLRRLGFRLFDLDNRRAIDFSRAGLGTLRRHPAVFLDQKNPFRAAVELAARKV